MAVSTAIDATAIARTLGIETKYVNLAAATARRLPQQIAVIGQGNTAATYSTDPRRVFSALEAGQVYGFGSPVNLVMSMLTPRNGDGVGTIPVTVYPLEDAGTGVAATGDITPSVTTAVAASYVIRCGGVDTDPFVVLAGASVADITAAGTTAINAKLEMPVTAVDGTTKIDLTSKWKGTSANGIEVSVIGPTDQGVTWAFTQPAGGLVNPTVDDALTAIGQKWETLVLNCLDTTDDTALDTYQTWGEGRWGALSKKPAVVFTGANPADVAAAIAVPDARKTDRVNAQLVAVGGSDLPCVVAARQLARIAKTANNNPPVDYGGQKATGLNPGTDAVQWDYPKMDAAVKGGSSTSISVDGVIEIGDVVTFYHPAGEDPPAYRYVVDIVRLQNVIYNFALIFNAPEWVAAPLIPDSQVTTNPAAKKPKMAKAAANGLIESLGNEAILSDPEASKALTDAAISETNPKRLDLSVTVSLSGNTNVRSMTLNWGFYYGQPVVVG